LNYKAEELRSVAFTVDELAAMLHVSGRQVRRWKENGWLKTTRRRVTDEDLAAFIKEHHGRIAYHLLARHVKVFLLSIGFPVPEAAKFQAIVKSILDDVAGRKKRRDARDDDWEPTLPRPRPPTIQWIPTIGNPGFAFGDLA
jgi:hypothetical protein